MKSAVATALCAASNVSLNNRHDAPRGHGYNIQKTASGSDNLQSCMLKNESRSPGSFCFSVSPQLCRHCLKSYVHFTVGVIKIFLADNNEPDTKRL